VRLSATREIDRPAEDVFAFFADASNNPRWQKGQVSCEWVTPPPVEVGSIYQQEARFLGRRVLTRFEVVEYVPGRVIAINSVESSFPIRVRRTVEPLGSSRSRVTTDIKGDPGGFFRIVGPMLRWLAQHSVDADYDRLKQLLDSGQTLKH
jgi:uncharacterized membrane protein